MYVKSTIVEDYGNFPLNISKIELYSTHKWNIELPYSGPTPEQFTGASNPRLYFNVQAAQGSNVFLLADRPNGNEVRAIIEISREEIKDILMRFFYKENGKTRFDCGLAPYWLGVWTSHFMEWEHIRYHMRDIIEELPIAERAALLAEIQYMNVTV